MHELIYAVDDCQNKHGPVFKKMALKLGLKGPMRSAGAGPELLLKLEAIAFSLGPYPHARLTVPRRAVSYSPRPRAKCGVCGIGESSVIVTHDPKHSQFKSSSQWNSCIYFSSISTGSSPEPHAAYTVFVHFTCVSGWVSRARPWMRYKR